MWKSLAVIGLLLIVGCEGSGGPLVVPITDDFSHIQDPQARWQAYHLTDYRIEESEICFCPGEHAWLTVVRNGQVVGRGYTVEQLFAKIEQAKQGAENYRASYDPKYGFPTEIFIDWRLGIADDEVSYTMANLEQLAH